MSTSPQQKTAATPGDRQAGELAQYLARLATDPKSDVPTKVRPLVRAMATAFGKITSLRSDLGALVLRIGTLTGRLEALEAKFAAMASPPKDPPASSPAETAAAAADVEKAAAPAPTPRDIGMKPMRPKNGPATKAPVASEAPAAAPTTPEAA